MRTWEEYKQKVRKEGGVAQQILEQAETSSRLTAAMCEARERLGLSQRDLAEAAGVAQSVVSRFETGETSPQLDTLVKLFSPLGLELRAVPHEVQMETTVIVDTLGVAVAAGKAILVDDCDYTWDSKITREATINAGSKAGKCFL